MTQALLPGRAADRRGEWQTGAAAQETGDENDAATDEIESRRQWPRIALLRLPLLSACAPAAMGPVTVFADPGKYEYHSCEQIAAQRTYWTGRELEMKLLMDKADQGTGGAVVNVIAYQGDYVLAREELKVIDATARAKNCDAPRRP